MEMREIDEIGPKGSRLILRNETYAIIGAALEVYYKLGNGFSESVHQEALGIEFDFRGIPFEREKWMKITYKGRELEKMFRVDFICYDQIIVELKSVSQLSPIDWSQVLNYLKISNLRVGLLFNFGSVGRLEHKRLIL